MSVEIRSTVELVPEVEVSAELLRRIADERTVIVEVRRAS